MNKTHESKTGPITPSEGTLSLKYQPTDPILSSCRSKSQKENKADVKPTSPLEHDVGRQLIKNSKPIPANTTSRFKDITKKNPFENSES